MFFKYAVFFFFTFLFFVDTEAADSNPKQTSSLNLDSLKKNMDAFKNCIDQSLANVVGDVNEDHLQPLINVIGDHLNRFSRAFSEIAGPSSSAGKNNPIQADDDDISS